MNWDRRPPSGSTASEQASNRSVSVSVSSCSDSRSSSGSSSLVFFEEAADPRFFLIFFTELSSTSLQNSFRSSVSESSLS